MIARDGELPKIFDRKVFHGAREGLLITTTFVIISLNLLPLDRIAMLGSAVFLIIYGSVNIAHLRVIKRTKAKPLIIWTAILGDGLALVVLIIYTFKKAPDTLIVLIIVIIFTLILEYIYQKLSNRELKIRRIRRL